MFEEDGDVGLGRYEYWIYVHPVYDDDPDPEAPHKFGVEVVDWFCEGGEPTFSRALAAARRLAIRRARYLDRQRPG
jgi:hypothetical protein